MRLGLHGLRGCGRTNNLAESEMPKQENKRTGEQVEKPIVRWIYSLFAYHDTGNILKQLVEEPKGGIPEDTGICPGRVAIVPVHCIPVLWGWK